MGRLYGKAFFDDVLSSNKNWEANIARVSIESCDRSEDPLGYRAAFFVKDVLDSEPSFVIGASYLTKRKQNLLKSDYLCPMTEKAISMIEAELGQRLAKAM